MAEKKTTKITTGHAPAPDERLFTRENYIWMLAGLAIIALGMFLMSGGKSPDPMVFDQKEIYSPRRITIAPILIIIGLGLEVFAIFRKPKETRNS
jgi:hypothetical protein